MKVSKRQLKKLIREEKRRLLEQDVIPPREEHVDTYYDDDAYGQSGNRDVRNYRVTMLVAVLPGQEEYILESIEQGMEFMEGAGEGILEYDIQEVP